MKKRIMTQSALGGTVLLRLGEAQLKVQGKPKEGGKSMLIRQGAARELTNSPICQDSPHRKNGILAAFVSEDLERLRASLEIVDLERGALLYDVHESIKEIYFPHSCVLSLVALMEDGRVAEQGTVGREGFTGSETMLSDEDTSNSRCIVQVPGRASRISLAALRSLVDERPRTRKLLMTYTRALFAQVLQSVACNAVHNIEQRCARWLLMTHNRAEADSFELTQEFLAAMLGVRRASVNHVTTEFREAGFISCNRGTVTVLDRTGLEAASCECYGIVRRVFEELLPNSAQKRRW